MKMRIIIVLIGTAIAAGCVQQPVVKVGQGKNFGVSLEPKVQPNKEWVKVLSKPQGYQKAGKKDGYVGYAPGESGVTLFSVKKEDLGDSCAGTAEWVITRVDLASQGDPDEQKGSNFGSTPQDPWLDEAFPDVEADGNLYQATEETGQTFVLIENANGQLGYRMIYYRVELTRCSDGKTLVTDPAWGNGGRTTR